VVCAYCIKVVPPARLGRHVFGVLGGLALIFSAFFLNFGAAYGATPLEDKIGLEISAPSTEDLTNRASLTRRRRRNPPRLPLDSTAPPCRKGRRLDPYSNSPASAVTDTINDTYLKLQGESAGTKSYGLVVDLAVA